MKSILRNLAIAAICGSPAFAATSFTFDGAASVSSWRLDFGDASGLSTVAWNAVEGKNGAGSLQLNYHFPNNGVAFTGDVFPSVTDFSGQTISFDIKVDPGSATDAFGNNGYYQFVVRNTDGYVYNAQAAPLQGNLNDANGWVNFSAPLTGSNAVRAFTIQLYGGPDQNLPGDVTLYIDNINIVPEPSAAMLVGLGVFGACARRRRH
jgi:hypothetical protein